MFKSPETSELVGLGSSSSFFPLLWRVSLKIDHAEEKYFLLNKNLVKNLKHCHTELSEWAEYWLMFKRRKKQTNKKWIEKT